MSAKPSPMAPMALLPFAHEPAAVPQAQSFPACITGHLTPQGRNNAISSELCQAVEELKAPTCPSSFPLSAIVHRHSQCLSDRERTKWCPWDIVIERNNEMSTGHSPLPKMAPAPSKSKSALTSQKSPFSAVNPQYAMNKHIVSSQNRGSRVSDSSGSLTSSVICGSSPVVLAGLKASTHRATSSTGATLNRLMEQFTWLLVEPLACLDEKDDEQTAHYTACVRPLLPKSCVMRGPSSCHLSWLY